MKTGGATGHKNDPETPPLLPGVFHFHSDTLSNSFSCSCPPSRASRRKENSDRRFSLKNPGGSWGKSDTLQPSQPHSKSIFCKDQHSLKVRNYTGRGKMCCFAILSVWPLVLEEIKAHSEETLQENICSRKKKSTFLFPFHVIFAFVVVHIGIMV